MFCHLHTIYKSFINIRTAEVSTKNYHKTAAFGSLRSAIIMTDSIGHVGGSGGLFFDTPPPPPSGKFCRQILFQGPMTMSTIETVTELSALSHTPYQLSLED